MVSSSLSIQSADWLSEDLKSAACLSFAGVGVSYIWHQRTTSLTPALYQKAHRLLEDRFALNRSESDWNLAGSLVYDMSAEEHKAFLANVTENPKVLELYEDSRINMSLEENVKPDRLRALKNKIIITCTFETIDQKKLSAYNDELKTAINELQSQNMWQQLTQKKADQELLHKLTYKQEQMIAFKEIIDAKKASERTKRLQDMFGIN